jgi:hypothetical protein
MPGSWASWFPALSDRLHSHLFPAGFGHCSCGIPTRSQSEQYNLKGTRHTNRELHQPAAAPTNAQPMTAALLPLLLTLCVAVWCWCCRNSSIMPQCGTAPCKHVNSKHTTASQYRGCRNSGWGLTSSSRWSCALQTNMQMGTMASQGGCATLRGTSRNSGHQ